MVHIKGAFGEQKRSKSRKPRQYKDFRGSRKAKNQNNTNNQGENTMNNKIKFPLYLEPRTMKMVEDNYKAYARSRSDYIEKAVIFYSGYLNADNADEFYPEVIKTSVKKTLESLENRMAKLLFKLTVEIAIVENVTAAISDIDEVYLRQLRAYCVDEVKRLNGRISLEDAVRYQNGED